MPPPIFIVDSSPAVRRLVEQISTSEGFEVIGFHDGPAALEAARRTSPALIIADYNLDNMTFSGFCREINKLDHLAETQLISLINPADHPDEGHLRSLGVRACLNKPFQSDELLNLIKSFQQQRGGNNSAGLKPRTWPPTASATDSDQAGGSPNHLFNSFQRREEDAMNQVGASHVSIPASQPAVSQQDAMKGFFDHLLQSVAKETENRLVDLLPRAMEEKLSRHVQPMVQNEIRTQLGEILSAEQLTAIIHPILSRELPSLLEKELTRREPVIRQAVSDVAEASVKEQLDRWIKKEAEASIQKHLSDLIHTKVGPIDQMVKDEVRTAAQQTVERTVQQVVPDLAEQHIKAELERLTASD